MSWERAGTLAELWSGDMAAAIVGGTKVLLVRLGDSVHAYEDRCAHLGVALSEGRLEDGIITCSAHHWQYDAATGKGINPARACVPAFAVRVEGGDIFVDPDRRAGDDR